VQRYEGKKLLFGYKVHTVLCHALDLPVFAVVTPAQVQDKTIGCLIVLASACWWCMPMQATLNDTCSGSASV
jgi:hypothetical protein